MSAKLDRAPDAQSKFASGQHNAGLYEFDSSEVFLLEDGTAVQLIGSVPIGAIFRLQRSGNLGQSRFQAVGRRREGQRFVLQAERLPGSNDCFGYLRYRGPARVPYENFPVEVDIRAGIEAVERANGGNCPLSYYIRVRSIAQWVDAAQCCHEADPYLTSRSN